MKRLMCAAAVAGAQHAGGRAGQSGRGDAEGARRARRRQAGQVKALTLEGPFAREMGNRQMPGTHRADACSCPATCIAAKTWRCWAACRWSASRCSPATRRGKTCRTAAAWGGGMQIVMRPGPAGHELNAEQLEQARAAPHAHRVQSLSAGVPRRREIAADLRRGRRSARRQGRRLEVKNEAGQAVRLFVDQNTHMPLMLQYQEVRPRVSMMGGPGGPAAVRRRRCAAVGGGGGGGRRAAGGAVRPAVAAAVGRWRRRRAATVSVPNPEEMRRRMESDAAARAEHRHSLPRRLQEGRRRHAAASPDAGGRRQDGRGMDDREGQGQPVDQGRSVREEVDSHEHATMTTRDRPACSSGALFVCSRWCALALPALAASRRGQSTLRVTVRDETKRR